MIHNSLERYYRMAFSMRTEFGFHLPEIEAMHPFEFDIYTMMLKQKTNSGGNGR